MKRPVAIVRLRGFSLLEITISFSLLGVLLGSLLVVLSTGTRSASTAVVCQNLEAAARRTLERMASELECTGPNVLVPDPTSPFGSASLTFQCIDGIDADLAAVWGTPVRLALQLEQGESNDDSDNDGDGLVDEHDLIWTIDPGGHEERSVVLIHGVREYGQDEEPNGRDDNGNGLVDERGLSFVRERGRLTVRLTLVGRDGGRAEISDEIVSTVQTTLRLRN